MKNIIILLIFVSNIVSAQTVDALFEEANSLYKSEKYQQAINKYKEIESSGNISSELYFNLGNCYYKLHEVAPSIYNYEKALFLDPSNEDAGVNLIIAKKLTLDRIEELPETLFQKLNKNYLKKLHYNTWAILAVVLSVLMGIFFLLFYFSDSSRTKRLYFIISFFNLFLLSSVLLIAYHQFTQSESTKEAIVFVTEVSIKNEPTANSDEIFTLHEGAKVMVIDTVDEWNKIKLVDSKIGWLRTKNIKIIDNF